MSATKKPPITLESDRTDAVPTDPETHVPTAYVPASYINTLVDEAKDLRTQVNLLIDEVAALRGSGGGGSGGGTGGGTAVAWPSMLHRWICWKRPSATAFVPDEVTLTGPRLNLFGGATVDADGVLIRDTSASGPRYAMAETPTLNLAGNYSIMVLVKDFMSNPSGGAYVATGHSRSGRSYTVVYKDDTGLAATLRNTDDYLISTLDSPDPAPLAIRGTGWKLIELVKYGTGFGVEDLTKSALDISPNAAVKRVDATRLGKYVVSSFDGGVNRVAAGIVPRMFEAGELKGLGIFTLGAIFVFSTNQSPDQRAVMYRTVRQAMLNAGLSEVLPAPTT